MGTREISTSDMHGWQGSTKIECCDNTSVSYYCNAFGNVVDGCGSTRRRCGFLACVGNRCCDDSISSYVCQGSQVINGCGVVVDVCSTGETCSAGACIVPSSSLSNYGIISCGN